MTMISWKKRNPEKVKAIRERRKEKQAKYYKEWYRKFGRKRSKNYSDVIVLWQRDNPEKKIASFILRQALVRGLLSKPLKCELCGKIKTRINGHHKDYKNPLVVCWVCNSCHKRLHLKINLTNPKT